MVLRQMIGVKAAAIELLDDLQPLLVELRDRTAAAGGSADPKR